LTKEDKNGKAASHIQPIAELVQPKTLDMTNSYLLGATKGSAESFKSISKEKRKKTCPRSKNNGEEGSEKEGTKATEREQPEESGEKRFISRTGESDIINFCQRGRRFNQAAKK